MILSHLPSVPRPPPGKKNPSRAILTEIPPGCFVSHGVCLVFSFPHGCCCEAASRPRASWNATVERCSAGLQTFNRSFRNLWSFICRKNAQNWRVVLEKASRNSKVQQLIHFHELTSASSLTQLIIHFSVSPRKQCIRIFTASSDALFVLFGHQLPCMIREL